MNTEEFYQLAGFLVGATGPSTESRHRTAISRYYYAAFLEMRNRLETVRGLRFNSHRSHDHVRQSFERSVNGEVKRLGRLIGDLKKLREKADYSIAQATPRVDVDEAKHLSEAIRAGLQAADLSQCIDPTGRGQ